MAKQAVNLSPILTPQLHTPGAPPATPHPEKPGNPQNPEAVPFQEDIAVLFPGKEVLLSEGRSVRVFPVTMPHVRKFYKGLFEAFATLFRTPQAQRVLQEKSTESMSALLPHIAPIIVNDLYDLMKECCRPSPDTLPHWDIPLVAQAFVEENFLPLELKLKPWMKPMDDLVSKLTGEPFSIWATIFKLSSAAGIQLKESLKAQASASTASPSPLEDGQSPNSGIGSSAPAEVKTTAAPSSLET